MSSDTVRHYIFPTPAQAKDTELEVMRAFRLEIENGAREPQHILLTGGASCPDGIIQQVINRINGFFPAESLRSPEAVLADFESED